ncbi:MAG: hypothetical protein LC128_08385 [Chitinophagales bacterium]|nr:hypothetical protein [Chitinophagales bacterium]
MSDQLRNKMYDHEVTPPQGVWEKIAAELNEQKENSSLTSKLYNLEVTPPPSAWEQIKIELEKDEKPIISGSQNVIHILRYAAAILILALMAFGAVRFLRNSYQKKEIATNKNLPYQKDSIRPSEKDTGSTSFDLNEFNETNDDQALEESKHTIAKNNLSPELKRKLANENFRFIPAHYINDQENTGISYLTLSYSDILRSMFGIGPSPEDISDRYIMLKDSDGNFFRVSKKLSDLICCISGEEQDADCKDKLQRWREKIASSPLAPTPGNFMDILSLISSLQNDQ